MAEEKSVDEALRKHNLSSHEATTFNDDPGHCFFHSFLDGWACTDFPTQHVDIYALRKDVKKCLQDEYDTLNSKGIIDEWLQEYPDKARRIHEAGARGQSIENVKKYEWEDFCNGYALNGNLPSGARPRMGDDYTCIAVAHIYRATVNVHHGTEAPLVFEPLTGVSYCTINLVNYCAPQWKHYRSTRPMVSPPASHGPVSVTQVMGEDQPGVRNSARSGGCYANGPGPEESAPDNYSARIHPATKEVIDRHLATINRLLQEGKALQEDVDRFKFFLDVYEILPPRPNTQPQRENWDSLDPMAPLGLPVGKRISGQDYVGYIVGYDHRKELGSYLVRYEDGDHRHFKKRQLDEYRNYYEIIRNRSQPLVHEQPPEAEDQPRDPTLTLFADLVTVPGTYADTILNAGGFAFLAQLSHDNRLFLLRSPFANFSACTQPASLDLQCY